MRQNSHVLVVDDNTWNLDLILQSLLQQDYTVTLANNGKEALEKIKIQHFDLVLLDKNPAKTDGLTVLKKIRDQFSPNELPVIMIVDDDKSVKIGDILACGASDYVTKPIDLTVLMTRIKSQLYLVHAHRKVALLSGNVENRNDFVMKLFNRYVTRNSVSTQPKGDKRTGGEYYKVTMLYTDILNFKKLSNSLPTQDIVSILNNYFEVITRVIRKYRGTVDQFVGNGLLTTFGAEVTGNNDVELAIACALEMQLAMEKVNERNRSNGHPDIKIGIGINTGSVMVGTIVSNTTTNVSVLGKHVNLAAKIESYANPREILISSDTYTELGNKVQVIGSQEILPEGSDRSIKIYSICGLRGEYSISLNAISLQENRELLDQAKSA